MDIKDLLIKILKEEFDNDAFVGTVTSVNGNLVTVRSLFGQSVYSNIRLQAIDGNGIILTPAVGSFVIVGKLGKRTGYIAMASDLDSIQFLDGSYGGLIKIQELVDKLNTVEDKVNDLITYINTHVHPSTGTPPSPLYAGGSLTNTTVNDIENDLITHGTV